MRIGDERILGDSAFIEKVLNEDVFAMDSWSSLSSQGWDTERLVAKVCAHFGVSRTHLTRKSRASDISMAKAMMCYLGHEKLRLSTREIAEVLKISQPAVSKWIVKEHGLSLDCQEYQDLLE